MGARQTVGTGLSRVVSSIQATLVFFFVLFLLRVVLRNRWLAAALFVAIFTAPKALVSNHPLIEMPIWVIIYSIAALAVVRFGLIVLAAAVFVADVMLNVPFTLDSSAWYASNSFLVLLGFVALAAWGFYTSLGGQRLWKDELFE